MTQPIHNTDTGLIEGPFLFIVNPNSGTGAVKTFLSHVKTIRHSRAFEVVESRSGAHSKELASSAGSKGFAAVIAVGGDGSVHEIGTQLIGSKVTLGIIPTGSGNGIARHLHISMNVKTAIKQALDGNMRSIDTFRVNGRAAIGFCGVGFDGHIARLFDEGKKRGFFNYAKLVFQAFSNYEASDFQVRVNGSPEQELKAYTLVFANINQFGNNARINPRACDHDGALEMIAIKPFPSTAFPFLASRLFLGNIDKSKYVSLHAAERFSIQNKGGAEIHVDGEPIGMAENLNFEVIPRSLNVIAP